MKILLLGDFSTVNLNLKFGLENLGHNVTLVSHGDGFKALDSDIKVYSRKQNENKYIGALKEVFDQYKISKKLNGFDIVQTASHLFYHNRIDKYLFPKIFQENEKTVLLNTACSVPYNAFVKTLKYSACSDCKLFELPNNKCVHEEKHTRIIEYNRYEKYNAIVSTHFEYYQSFNQTPFKNKNHFIPVGMRLDQFDYNPLKIKGDDKINIYYGEIRKGFKGGVHIEAALEKLKGSSYTKYFNIITTNRLSFAQYLDVIKKCHILIDQSSSYSYGVNALVGLSLGKVVMSGAESEAISLITNDPLKNPIVNILPSADDIFDKLIWFLNNKEQINSVSLKSRIFVEEFHAIEKVAKQYEQLYLSI